MRRVSIVQRETNGMARDQSGMPGSYQTNDRTFEGVTSFVGMGSSISSNVRGEGPCVAPLWRSSSRCQPACRSAHASASFSDPRPSRASSRCTSGGRSPPSRDRTDERSTGCRSAVRATCRVSSSTSTTIHTSRRSPLRPAGTSATAAVRVGSATYDAARREMAARVRMETPVLYFYSDRDTTVRVRVSFHHGLMTEWFPPAAVSQGAVGSATLRDPGATQRDRVAERPRDAGGSARVCH